MQISAVLGYFAGNVRDFYKSTMQATRPLNRIIRVGLGLCELYQFNTYGKMQELEPCFQGCELGYEWNT
jgi:hypothetical protein